MLIFKSIRITITFCLLLINGMHGSYQFKSTKMESTRLKITRDKKEQSIKCRYTAYHFVTDSNPDKPISFAEFYTLWMQDTKPFISALKNMFENYMENNQALKTQGFYVRWCIQKNKPFEMQLSWPKQTADKGSEKTAWITAWGDDLKNIQNTNDQNKPNKNFTTLTKAHQDKKSIAFLSSKKNIIVTLVPKDLDDTIPATLYQLIKQDDEKKIKAFFKLSFHIWFSLQKNGLGENIRVLSRGGPLLNQTEPRVHTWTNAESFKTKIGDSDNYTSEIIAWLNDQDKIGLDSFFKDLAKPQEKDYLQAKNEYKSKKSQNFDQKLIFGFLLISILLIPFIWKEYIITKKKRAKQYKNRSKN